MDNLTHSFVGLVAGHGLLALKGARRPSGSSGNVAPILTASVIANNFPDLDLLYSRVTPGKLGYLLHHRGYTHTLGGIVVQLILLLIVFELWARWHGRDEKQRRRGDWAWITATLLLGLCTHVAMDSMNVYGVHPFWPFNSRWFYGDAVFILEPWLWATFLPFLFCNAPPQSIGRLFYAALFIFTLGLCWLTGYVPWFCAGIVTLWGLWFFGLMWLTQSLTSRARAAVSIGTTLASACAVIGMFFSVSKHVRAEVTSWLGTRFPESQIHDIALSPFPANPICWSVYTVETDEDRYLARRGVYSIAPRILPAIECPDLRTRGSTAKLSQVQAPLRPEVAWDGQFQAPLSELGDHARSSCVWAAALRFLRVPVWRIPARTATSEPLILGDLRFDRTEALDFADLPIDALDDRCPPHVPPWVQPRRDLLERYFR